MRIIVVDDNRDTADSLAKLLSLSGHECIVAYSFGAAEELAAERPHDAMIVDLLLPGGSGVEFVRRRRAGGDDAPIALVTTGPPEMLESAQLKCIGLPGVVFERKPFSPEKMVQALEAMR